MKLGIIGLPNVGKSTLFNALTKAKVPCENYPFCTIDPNIGTVPIPDNRLFVLQKIYEAKKIVHAVVNFVDIAGLVKGASEGEGLGNKFLSHIREVDAIVHIVRCFANPDIIHVHGIIDPVSDIEIINTELILADIESLQRRIDKAEKVIRTTNEKKAKKEFNLMKNLAIHLSSGNPARTFTNNNDEKQTLNELFLLTNKPIIYVANFSEEDLTKNIADNLYLNKIKEIANKETAEVIVVSASIEEEIAQLDETEKKEFLHALGFEESGLDRLIHASYKLLGLFSFLTAGKPEVRAWTIKKGTNAPQAAGTIHSDFERGFIKAEVINYYDLVKYGSINQARQDGKVRIEGKDYIIQEEDVIYFRFNV